MISLSVIIPAFRPRDFAALARSMEANADARAEWIVVDDGSGPGHDAVFAKLPERVRLIRQSRNRRQGAARNAGLAQARGRWVKFLDADDELDKGHLAALLAAAERLPDRTLAFAPTKHVFADGATHLNYSWRGLPADPQAQMRRLLVRPFLHHCGALYPRDLLTGLGGYEESLITDEDGDLLLRLLQAEYQFAPVEGVAYLYVHGAGGGRVSADDDIAKMQARIRVCDRFEARQTGPLDPGMAEALAQRMDRIAMTYWPAFPRDAQALLDRARRLSPGYVPDMRAPLRLLRALGGPGMVFAATGLYRRLRGRPKGGTQG
jgi:glycosyltransferase involved in cell wall biosynthesis